MDFSESASHVSRAIALSAIIICFFFRQKKGIFGYKRFLFPLIKPVCSSSMMSSDPHEIAAHEGAVPVPFRHRW
jgi:hypothetical protein